MFQNKNYKRQKSYDKYKKAFEWYTDILKKEVKWTMAKWVAKTKIKAQARLKKFWITDRMVADHLSKKGLKDLLS